MSGYVDWEFLSGLCGHELIPLLAVRPPIFLSGLCGHEHFTPNSHLTVTFLSGLCGHER